ncbi:MAG: extracellular solute-binding protein [Clostridia bacterium]
MTHFKKIIASTLVCATILTGCSNSATTNGSSTSSSDSTEPATLSFFYYDGLRVFKPTQPIWEYIQEQTNITLVGAAPTTAGSDSDEQFNLMLASNDIPDIIQGSTDNLLETGQDLLIPLDDLIAEYAPNLQKMFDENPDVKASSSIDGQIYFVPYLLAGSVSEIMYIRQDWLDKFDLDIPETTEEYIEALQIFLDEDANGNGKADEIGFFDRVNTNLNAIGSMFNLYGASLYPYVEDGVVKDDRFTEEFKEAVLGVADMYERGLIDPELFTRGSDSRNIMFNANIGASTVDWAASTGQYQLTYEDEIEGLNWVPMLPTVAPNGRQFTQYSRSKIYSSGWGISFNCDDTVSAIKLLDYLFSEEGSRAMNYGIEGETYDMIDGKPIFKEELLNGDIPVNDVLMDMGVLQIGYQQDADYEAQWTIDLANQGVEMYSEASPYLDTILNLSLPFTAEEIEAKSKIETTLGTYVEEMIQKWVLGSADIDSTFDDYLAKVTSEGYEDLLEIYQTAYDRTYN